MLVLVVLVLVLVLVLVVVLVPLSFSQGPTLRQMKSFQASVWRSLS